MTFYYSLDPNEQSTMTIGGVDTDLFQGEITWAPVIKGHHYYWLIELDDVKVGNKSYGFCKHGCKAAVDTGTSMLTAPSQAYRKLQNKIKLHCNDLDRVPDLVYVISGKEFPIPAREYVLTFTSEGEEDPGMHSDDVEDCMTAFMAMDISAPEGPLWVLGDIFLSRYYSIFDRDHDRVGFARAVHSYD
jgi:cathepsin D